MRADVTSRTLPSSSGPYMLACLSISQPISHLLHVSYISHCCILLLQISPEATYRCKIIQTSFPLHKVCIHLPEESMQAPEKLNYFTLRSFLGREYDPHFTLTSSLLLHPSRSSIHASLFLIYSQKKNNCI